MSGSGQGRLLTAVIRWTAFAVKRRTGTETRKGREPDVDRQGDERVAGGLATASS